MTRQYMEDLWKKIEYMEEKCKKDPSWINKMLLECMIADYEAKQKQRIKLQQEGKRIYGH